MINEYRSTAGIDWLLNEDRRLYELYICDPVDSRFPTVGFCVAL